MIKLSMLFIILSVAAAHKGDDALESLGQVLVSPQENSQTNTHKRTASIDTPTKPLMLMDLIQRAKEVRTQQCPSCTQSSD